MISLRICILDSRKVLQQEARSKEFDISTMLILASIFLCRRGPLSIAKFVVLSSCFKPPKLPFFVPIAVARVLVPMSWNHGSSHSFDLPQRGIKREREGQQGAAEAENFYIQDPPQEQESPEDNRRHSFRRSPEDWEE